MKLNKLLSFVSTLSAVPTGWAIYAGVTEHPTFPMNAICAILGAIGVVCTSIAAGLLVTDIKAYNQGLKNKTEHEEFEMSTATAWAVFGGCVVAELSLSLLIVVIHGALVYGVLAFPLITAAGVFAFAVRHDLSSREADLLKARIERKQVARKPKKEKENLPQEEPILPKLSRKHVKDDDLLAYLASNKGESQQEVAEHFGVTRQAIGQRMKKIYEVK